MAICPVFPLPAPRRGWTVRWLEIATTGHFTAWVNLAGLPDLTVTAGCSARTGLPMSMQLVGMPGSEPTLLAAGLVLQQALMPEWRGPPLGCQSALQAE